MKTIWSLIAVGFLWGATNPFIKRGSKGIENIETGSKWKNLFLELKHVGTKLKYWIPFLLNQSGSVLFVWTLQNSPLTAAVPISNSLSFVFTAITGHILGEKLPTRNILIGTTLVSLGSSIMIYDKMLLLENTSIDVEFNENIPTELTR